MSQSMSSEQKKAFLLLKFVVFNYHGLDANEKAILENTAQELNAIEELNWAKEFISTDPASSFDRARTFFTKTISTYDMETKLSYLNSVWNATNIKGFVSEIEAMTMLKLAKDWGIQKALLDLVRKK
jgi:hypothetical protein